MIAPTIHRQRIIPRLAAIAFAPKPDIPLPIWSSKNVMLDRRITTRPGLYDPYEFPWTWEFQEILRTRQVVEKTLPDGSVIIVDNDQAGRPGTSVTAVRQLTVEKSSVGGFTEGALNEVRYAAAHDPQNIGFAIDSRTEAGTINEIRLQPTLRRLGAEIFTDNDDDASKFLLKLKRMLVYFLGSYSAGAFANKMFELAIVDELEEHGTPAGDTSNVENMRSRIKSARRGLLVLISKPKLAGGPIDAEHKKGSMHVPEVPCIHCTEENGGIPAGHQELVQDNMHFEQCKSVTGEWDFDRVAKEADFQCIHCKKMMQVERNKRWMNARDNRRWRRTNDAAEPGHISMQVSDFLSYLITIGELANRYIRSKGDPVARQGYRNHHEGKAYEIRESKTEIADLLLLRSTKPRGIMPWLPRALVFGSDVGLTYVKWVVLAIRITPEYPAGEACCIDYGIELHPDDAEQLIRKKRYRCDEDGQEYGITIGGMDEKYRKLDVQRACHRSQGRLLPTAGLAADYALKSISFSQIPQAPQGFGIVTYNDRDAKHDLYTESIGAWVKWIRAGSPPEDKPLSAPLTFFKDITDAPGSPHAEFLKEFTKEPLIEVPGAHASKQFVFKRIGPNHWGDATKVAKVIWRYFSPNAA